MSRGGGERTRCPVSGTCRGRQISRWSVPKCPPAVCNRIFQATAGSLWGNFVRRRSQIRVNAAQRFLHYTGRSGSLSLPPRQPALSAPIRHKGFLPAKLSGHFWHLQQTNCCLQSWQALWSPNELASSAEMKKKLQNQCLSRITLCHQPKTGEERREEDANTDQARVSESRVCVIRTLSSNCSLSPSCFMAASLPSKPLYDKHCNVFRVLGSLWLGHAVLLSGPEWQWDQVQPPPPRTQSHKSSCWHWASLPEQLPVPAGDKKAFVGFRQPELLFSLRILRFMSNSEKDCGGKRESLNTYSFFLSY